jgi:hypothetical protein
MRAKTRLSLQMKQFISTELGFAARYRIVTISNSRQKGYDVPTVALEVINASCPGLSTLVKNLVAMRQSGFIELSHLESAFHNTEVGLFA